MTSTLLSLQDITFYYPENSWPVLKDTSFCFDSNQRIGLIGPNGQGKTTFFYICIGLLQPQKGVLSFKGSAVKNSRNLYKLRQSIGFLFQNPDDQLFCPTVLEDIAFGPLNLGYSSKEAQTIALQTLELVGLKGFENRVTHKLSGGEKKLLSLATILAMQPEALLLDEPTTGLDPNTRKHIVNILNKLDYGLIIVSHDWDFLNQTTNELYTLENAKIVSTDRGVLHQHVHYHPSGHLPHEHKNSEANNHLQKIDCATKSIAPSH